METNLRKNRHVCIPESLLPKTNTIYTSIAKNHKKKKKKLKEITQVNFIQGKLENISDGESVLGMLEWKKY